MMRIKRKYESVESNVGKIDKFVRIALSFILVLTLMRVRDSELTEEILLVLAILFFSTGLVGYCPLYSLVGISTGGIQMKTDKQSRG